MFLSGDNELENEVPSDKNLSEEIREEVEEIEN